jgi:hypothetical protein
MMVVVGGGAVGGIVAAGGAAASRRSGDIVVRIDSAVLVALASLHRCSWRRLFCNRLSVCGRRRRL